jgi:hypothetical protein
MNEAVRDCLVEGYEDLLDDLALPDPDDRHVLAAAIRSGAEIIITFNLKDFPAAILEQFEMAAVHPDDFVISLLGQEPMAVCAAVKRQREGLRNPPKTVEELLVTLDRQGLPKSVACLRGLAEFL